VNRRAFPGKGAIIIALSVGFATILACRQKEVTRPHDSDGPKMNWTNALASNRPVILTGEWLKAESGWSRLHLQRADNPEQIEEWIQLQVDILEQTRSDPLKSGLRMSAIQQLYYFSDQARSRLAWFRNGLATNLFVDHEVEQKAREILSEMEKNPTKGIKP
jgi:hypothetical protein